MKLIGRKSGKDEISKIARSTSLLTHGSTYSTASLNEERPWQRIKNNRQIIYF